MRPGKPAESYCRYCCCCVPRCPRRRTGLVGAGARGLPFTRLGTHCSRDKPPTPSVFPLVLKYKPLFFFFPHDKSSWRGRAPAVLWRFPPVQEVLNGGAQPAVWAVRAVIAEAFQNCFFLGLWVVAVGVFFIKGCSTSSCLRAHACSSHFCLWYRNVVWDHRISGGLGVFFPQVRQSSI